MSPKKRDMPKWKVVFQALFSEEYISVDSDCKFQFHYRPLKSLHLCGGNRDIMIHQSITPIVFHAFLNPLGSPPLPGTWKPPKTRNHGLGLQRHGNTRAAIQLHQASSEENKDQDLGTKNPRDPSATLQQHLLQLPETKIAKKHST